jgi:hypothetical protein
MNQAQSSVNYLKAQNDERNQALTNNFVSKYGTLDPNSPMLSGNPDFKRDYQALQSTLNSNNQAFQQQTAQAQESAQKYRKQNEVLNELKTKYGDKGGISALISNLNNGRYQSQGPQNLDNNNSMASSTQRAQLNALASLAGKNPAFTADIPTYQAGSMSFNANGVVDPDLLALSQALAGISL